MEAKTSKNIKAASENPSYFYFHALSSSASAFQSHDHKMAAVFPSLCSFSLSFFQQNIFNHCINTSWETLNKSLSVLFKVWISSGIKLKVLDQSWPLHMCNNQCIFIIKILPFLGWDPETEATFLSDMRSLWQSWDQITGFNPWCGFIWFCHYRVWTWFIKKHTLEFNKNDKVKVAFQFLISPVFIIQIGGKNGPSYPLSK